MKQLIKKLVNNKKVKSESSSSINGVSLSNALTETRTQILEGKSRPVFIDEEGFWFKTDFDFFVFSNLKDRILELEKNPQWETLETQFLINNLSPGSIFLDIGANLGYFSLVAAKKSECFKIYSIEPISSTYEMLCKNIAFNQYEEKIIPIQTALGNQEGTLEMITNQGPKNHILAEVSNVTERQDSMSERVRVTTLDILVKELGLSQIDFIKVDIEGYESFFLEGARQTLSQLPILLIEIQQKRCGIFGHEASKIVKSLLELGYRFLIVSKQQDKIITASSIEAGLADAKDFIFYHPDKHHLKGVFC